MKFLSLCLAMAAVGCGPKTSPPRETGPAPETAWPRFLGPNKNNVTEAKGLPLEWQDKKGKNIQWKVALPGEGWSTPVAADGRIYCTTALDDGKSLRVLCV